MNYLLKIRDKVDEEKNFNPKINYKLVKNTTQIRKNVIQYKTYLQKGTICFKKFTIVKISIII